MYNVSSVDIKNSNKKYSLFQYTFKLSNEDKATTGSVGSFPCVLGLCLLYSFPLNLYKNEIKSIYQSKAL